MHLIIAMHDSDPVRFPGTRTITLNDAPQWNENGYGIFTTVCSFDGRRTKDKLKRVTFWAVDLDAGTKPEMMKRIETAPLIPTLVIETKRGFHVWYAAKDGKPEHWQGIVWDRLVPYFGADKNAKDICRILRMPGFWHRKDPNNPFLVRAVWEYRVAYTEIQMALNFPVTATKEMKSDVRQTKTLDSPQGSSFWEKITGLNCEEALERLSGHPSVNGEIFTFRPNSSGTKNILVNGKSTSAWIDRNGKIGSLSHGGPSVANWLRWYGHSWSEVAQVIKEVFPECKM